MPRWAHKAVREAERHLARATETTSFAHSSSQRHLDSRRDTTRVWLGFPVSSSTHSSPQAAAAAPGTPRSCPAPAGPSRSPEPRSCPPPPAPAAPPSPGGRTEAGPSPERRDRPRPWRPPRRPRPPPGGDRKWRREGRVTRLLWRRSKMKYGARLDVSNSHRTGPEFLDGRAQLRELL